MTNRSIVFLLVVVLLASHATARADRVRTIGGTLNGQVTGMTHLGVTVTRGDKEEAAPVSELLSVQFANEPSELNQARVNAKNGGYETALKKLDAIDRSEIDNPFIKQDIAYYTALCQAKLALMGEGSLADAGRKLNTFVKQNRKSYHLLEATEILGDMLVAAENYDAAAKKYEILTKTPWPAYAMRAGVLLGNVSQAQGEHQEALRKFEGVLSNADDTPLGAKQKLRAKLGKAISLSATGKLDEGVNLVQAVIKDADAKEKDLNAAAYNALGGCYQQAGKTKDALFAYLHVDLLYSTSPGAHAEALYHLATLWGKLGQESRAREARETLGKRYASSQWAQR